MRWSSTRTCLMLGLLGCRGATAPVHPSAAPAPAAETIAPPKAAPASDRRPALEVPSETRALLAELTRARDDAGGPAPAPTPQPTKLAYDPLRARGLDRIQSSFARPSPDELRTLARQGFVIEQTQELPSYTYGYTSIYSADLPVFISADSILDAMHRSYDAILKDLERGTLRTSLSTLLSGLRQNLASTPADESRQAIDLYLEVADALLLDRPADGLSKRAAERVSAVRAAQGVAQVNPFEASATEDLSQYTPRGHYADEPVLRAYFRAAVWLGRQELSLLRVEGDRVQLERAQLHTALRLYQLLDPKLAALAERIDRVLQLFVGETDGMNVAQVPELLRRMQLARADELERLSDDALAAGLLESGLGRERILSRLVCAARGELPLSIRFGLSGQRYTLDAHVLGSVVWPQTAKKRMLPDPLDVAYAVFGNDHAQTLLAEPLAREAYGPQLQAARALVERHDATYWQGNLYNAWLGALRMLSPAHTDSAKLPGVARTEA